MGLDVKKTSYTGSSLSNYLSANPNLTMAGIPFSLSLSLSLHFNPKPNSLFVVLVLVLVFVPIARCCEYSGRFSNHIGACESHSWTHQH
jgi:glucose-6-phosphate-specific signal transduction histidine kinase